MCTFLKKWLCARTFLAPVRTCTLRSSSNFAFSPKIGCSPFSIFITFVSDCSFHANRSARARFRLPCARARSDQVQTLRTVLKLAVLHFLFSSLLSQTAPSVSFLVSQKIYGWRQKQKTSFNEIKGFLSLQLELRLELGFRLRLTNIVISVPAA